MEGTFRESKNLKICEVVGGVLCFWEIIGEEIFWEKEVIEDWELYGLKVDPV